MRGGVTQAYPIRWSRISFTDIANPWSSCAVVIMKTVLILIFRLSGTSQMSSIIYYFESTLGIPSQSLSLYHRGNYLVPAMNAQSLQLVSFPWITPNINEYIDCHYIIALVTLTLNSGQRRCISCWSLVHRDRSPSSLLYRCCCTPPRPGRWSHSCSTPSRSPDGSALILLNNLNTCVPRNMLKLDKWCFRSFLSASKLLGGRSHWCSLCTPPAPTIDGNGDGDNFGMCSLRARAVFSLKRWRMPNSVIFKSTLSVFPGSEQ